LHGHGSTSPNPLYGKLSLLPGITALHGGKLSFHSAIIVLKSGAKGGLKIGLRIEEGCQL